MICKRWLYNRLIKIVDERIKLFYNDENARYQVFLDKLQGDEIRID